jgi:hypothetical protein
MSGFVTRFLRDATAPLGAALSRGLIALVLVIAAIAMIGTAVVFLQIALFMWLRMTMPPLQAVLVLAGAWFAGAIVVLLIAWIIARRGKSPVQVAPVISAPEARPTPIKSDPLANLANMIDPIAKSLNDLGLQSESAALLAGAQLVRSMKTVQVMGLALIAGYVASQYLTTKNRD